VFVFKTKKGVMLLIFLVRGHVAGALKKGKGYQREERVKVRKPGMRIGFRAEGV